MAKKTVDQPLAHEIHPPFEATEEKLARCPEDTEADQRPALLINEEASALSVLRALYRRCETLTQTLQCLEELPHDSDQPVWAVAGMLRPAAEEIRMLVVHLDGQLSGQNSAKVAAGLAREPRTGAEA